MHYPLVLAFGVLMVLAAVVLQLIGRAPEGRDTEKGFVLEGETKSRPRRRSPKRAMGAPDHTATSAPAELSS